MSETHRKLAYGLTQYRRTTCRLRFSSPSHLQSMSNELDSLPSGQYRRSTHLAALRAVLLARTRVNNTPGADDDKVTVGATTQKELLGPPSQASSILNRAPLPKRLRSVAHTRKKHRSRDVREKCIPLRRICSMSCSRIYIMRYAQTFLLGSNF